MTAETKTNSGLQSISTEALIKELLLSIFDQNTESEDFKVVFSEVKRRLGK